MSRQAAQIYITYGERRSRVFDVTNETTNTDIERWVTDQFNPLPPSFHLQFYTPQAKFIRVDDISLPSIANYLNTTGPLQLFVVEDDPNLTSTEEGNIINVLLLSNVKHKKAYSRR